MQPTPSDATPPHRRRLRWWPAALILSTGLAALAWYRADSTAPFQQRNIATLVVIVITGLALLLWWLLLSRARPRQRLLAAGVVCSMLAAGAGLFRLRGVTGDLVPILEYRWAARSSPAADPAEAADVRGVPTGARAAATEDFPQFLGPRRTAVLDGPALGTNWASTPPQLVWRRAIGAAWSGWAVVGGKAFTQEQRGEDECVTCYELLTGRLLWSHSDPGHYNTTIAGEGPRCTPTVVGDRVYALGATGLLNCLDRTTGAKIWSRNIAADAKAEVPEWGFAGSPLFHDGCVVVLAGGRPDRSLLCYRAETGDLAWSGGDASAGYGSPFVATLAGVPQFLNLHSRTVTGQDTRSGKVLWEHPWGIGQPQVSVPVVISTNRVLFSSGYGVGSVLLEIQAAPDGTLRAAQIWRSNRLKSKFAPVVERQGFLYGLDDGIFTCLRLADGELRWKQGRYGHGQGLLVHDLFLLMSESGDLVLLQPTPDGPNEIHRFRVFHSKTWNPIALAGELVLCRNDREAACLRLPLNTP